MDEKVFKRLEGKFSDLSKTQLYSRELWREKMQSYRPVFQSKCIYVIILHFLFFYYGVIWKRRQTTVSWGTCLEKPKRVLIKTVFGAESKSMEKFIVDMRYNWNFSMISTMMINNLWELYIRVYAQPLLFNNHTWNKSSSIWNIFLNGIIFR